ncbi:MAG: tetratricopeptide repeat protein [Bryobacterales bacterium]|nr:tetratricopeptide repeat protein [Bryobacterales bacterium]
MNRTYWSAALLALALGVCTDTALFAQTTGGGTGGGGSTGGGRTPAPTRPTQPSTGPSMTGGDRQPAMMDIQRPIFLTGRLMMDDGNPPPEPVVMMLVCNGQPRPQGYSDMKGRFSVTLGQNNIVMPDASISGPNDTFGSNSTRSVQTGPTSGGMSERQLMGCEFRADLPGFRSDVLQLSGRRLMDNPEVGTLILHRLSNVEGFTFSMTSASAPKDSRKAYEKGTDLMKKKKYEEAEVHLRKAVDGYPKYALAWFELGRAFEAQKRQADAKTAYEQSVASDGKFVNPHLQLLQIAVNTRDWQQIAERSDTVLKLNPFNYPQIWYMNGAANYNLKKLDVAERSAREALKLDVSHGNPRISRLLGIILADKGDYPGALTQMQGYLSFAPDAPDVEVVRKQIAELQRITGAKTTAQTPPQQ